ncbi:MAG: hypothetical protein WC083_07640 [Candidatus Methanomethylophilaceae archaeon]
MNIDIDKIAKSDTPQEVIDVYRRVKRHFVDDPDRRAWKEIREKNWKAAYPLDTEKEGIWTEDEKAAMVKKGQIPIGVNDLAKGVQGSCAVVTSKSPGLNFSPIGESDLYVSELLKRGWDYVNSRNGGPITYFDWVKECKLSGLGLLEAKHDPSKGIFGKIVINTIDPTTYYFDKKSTLRDHSDVNFGKAHLVTKKYALETYDGLTEDDLIFNEISPDEADKEATDDYKFGKDNYALSEGKQADLPAENKDETEENVWEIEDWELVKDKELWLMIRSQEKPGEFDRKIFKTYAEIEEAGWSVDKAKNIALRETRGVIQDPMTGGMAEMSDVLQAVILPRRVEKRIQRIIVGKKLISKEENPLGVDGDGEPILPIIALSHDATLSGYPTGPVTRAYEISRSRNKRRMQSIYVVSRNIEAPIVMSAGCKWVKDEEHGDWIQVSKDSPFPPNRLVPGTTSAELVNMEQRDKEDISDEFDMSDVIRGKIPAGQTNMAGRTVLALQEMVGVMSQPFTLSVESAMERLGKSVASLMIKIWPKSMWLRLIEPGEMGTWQPDQDKQVGPDGQPVQPEPSEIQQKWMDAIARIRGEDGKEPISMIDIDVKIIAGSTQPTNRMMKKSEAMEMVKAGIYTPEIALEYVDDPLRDKAIESLKQQQQMAMQQEMMKQAQKGAGQ